MKCTKSVVVFCDWLHDHTRENTETIIYLFLFLGGGGGGGEGGGIKLFSN